MNVIEVQGLTKSFGARKVVDDVSLMKAGAILHHAYVAPSGRTLGTIRVSKDICGL